MVIRNNRKSATGLSFENVRDVVMLQAGALVAMPEGVIPTAGTLEIFAWGDAEDLQDGAPRVNVRNTTRHTPIERTIRLEAPLAAHVPSQNFGLPRVKSIEIPAGEVVNLRAEFLESQGARSMLEGRELVIEEAA